MTLEPKKGCFRCIIGSREFLVPAFERIKMTEFIYTLAVLFLPNVFELFKILILTDTGSVVIVWRETGLAEAHTRVDHPLAVPVAVVLWHRARGTLKLWR